MLENKYLSGGKNSLCFFKDRNFFEARIYSKNYTLQG